MSLVPTQPLSEEQIRRYSRQILLPEVGGRGQRALLASRVLLFAGHAFSETAGTYLAAAGVGALDVIDGDAGLIRRLAGVNPDCRVRALPLAMAEAEYRNAAVAPAAPTGAIATDSASPASSTSAIATGSASPAAAPAPARTVAVAGPADPVPAGLARVWAWCVGRLGRISRACPACLPAGMREAPEGPAAVDVAAVVGSLAAVAALHALLGIGSGPGESVLEWRGAEATAHSVPAPPDPGCGTCVRAGGRG